MSQFLSGIHLSNTILSDLTASSQRISEISLLSRNFPVMSSNRINKTVLIFLHKAQTHLNTPLCLHLHFKYTVCHPEKTKMFLPHSSCVLSVKLQWVCPPHTLIRLTEIYCSTGWPTSSVSPSFLSSSPSIPPFVSWMTTPLLHSDTPLGNLHHVFFIRDIWLILCRSVWSACPVTHTVCMLFMITCLLFNMLQKLT